MDIYANVKAYIPPFDGEKAKYIPIGVIFKRDEDQLVLKLDALPLPGSGWEGWCNIFPVDE